MILYHGTTVSDLDTLRANSYDREGRRVLYLTDNFPYSLFYIRDREVDFVTCGVREQNIVHYDEKFPNQLEILYRNRSGWVYAVDVEAEPTKTKGIYVVSGDVEVLRKTYIPDVWKSIYEEIHKGNVKLLSYDVLSETQKTLNQEGIVRLFLSGKKWNPHKECFFREHFPEAWQEAQNILAQSK